MFSKKNAGFTFVELVLVLLIVGILASTAASTLIPGKSFQLQATRDQVVMALVTGQQRAMSRLNAVAVIITASQIDIREDTNANDSFADEASLFIGGVQYPISLLASQTISNNTFEYDRLGQTAGATLTLSQSSATVTITVTDSGYVY